MATYHSWLSTPPVRKHPSCLTKQFAATLPVGRIEGSPAFHGQAAAVI